MNKTIGQFVGVMAVCASCSIWADVPKDINAIPLDIEKTDLTPLIESAATDPNKFAVDIPHAASPAKSGVWSVENGNAVWRYAVQVPDAVSLSFHAADVKIPSGAEVTLTNGTDAFEITSRSLNARGDLWSRMTWGSTTYISARMPADQRSAFSLTIVSLQAGFKGFGGRGNAKAYDVYASKAASSCQVNYSCAQTASNTLPSRAVVGVLINGTTFCTGTLMNNQRGDYKPYVLTARHCGLPENNGWDASGITIAWNAVAPCGQPLANVYSASTITSSGATTKMVSAGDAQGYTGDAWLIEMDAAPPIGARPYWEGYDATDGNPAGVVYDIHHGAGLQQQYAESTNPPSRFLLGANLSPGTIDGGYWSVVWTTSSTPAGASGSGLLDGSSNHLIGTATGAINSDHCPGDAYPPMSTFYRLGLSWTGNGNAAASVKFWLDPDATGNKVLDGLLGPPAVEVTSNGNATVGQSFTVSWSASDATSCLASGGTSGDGWPSGSITASGSAPITESAVGQVSYTVTCMNASGSKAASASVLISASSGGGGAGGLTGGGTGGGGNGSSGGGAFGVTALLPLVLLGLWRRGLSVTNKRNSSNAN